jgi:hypothetical protein
MLWPGFHLVLECFANSDIQVLEVTTSGYFWNGGCILLKAFHLSIVISLVTFFRLYRRVSLFWMTRNNPSLLTVESVLEKVAMDRFSSETSGG